MPGRAERTRIQIIRVAMVSVIAMSASYCESPDEGAAGLKACTHIDNANKDLNTFLQNHPIDGTVAPQSQGDVLAHMISELTAADAQDPPPQLGQTINQALQDAHQMETDIANKNPVRNGNLISDFDNLASLCGQLRSSNNVVAP